MTPSSGEPVATIPFSGALTTTIQSSGAPTATIQSFGALTTAILSSGAPTATIQSFGVLVSWIEQPQVLQRISHLTQVKEGAK
jgi:hypothetical protein